MNSKIVYIYLSANSEIEKLRKSTSIELQTLKAELRKAEIKISSLELTVQQKVIKFFKDYFQET